MTPMKISGLLHSLADQFRQPLSAEYGRALKTSLIQQLIVTVLSVLLLDGGLASHICALALIAYWLSVPLIIVRRRADPTPGDLWFVRYGFLVTEAAVWFVGQAVWQQMGRI